MADGPAPAPVSPAEVERAFEARGLRAPPAYAAFAAANGGKRFPAGQKYVRDKETGEVTGLSTVYHFAGNQPVYSIGDVWEETADELGPSLVPIATTDYAGLICLDYRAEAAEPPVVSYDFEAVDERKVTPLADDFTAFLSSIGPK